MPLAVAQARQRAASVAATYPHRVGTDAFSVLTRLRARLNATVVGDGLYLGYCARHRAYFLDHRHTNGVLRCPVCDTEWLRQRRRAARSGTR